MKKQIYRSIIFISTFLILLQNSANSVLADTISDSYADTTKINSGASSNYRVINGQLALNYQVDVGDGADGAITVASDRKMNTDMISTGRTVPDGATFAVTAIGTNTITTTVNDVLKFTSTNVAGTAYTYWKALSSSTTLATGDTIEYDVYLGNNLASLGGIDIKFTDATYARDVAGWTDQNAISCHPISNISAYANGAWYHRKCTVPAGLNGKTISYVDLVNEVDTATPITVYYDNLIIRNSAGMGRGIIYSQGAPDYNVLDFSHNAGNTGNVALANCSTDGLNSCNLASGLAAGDDILLINVVGDATNNANVGSYESLTVQSISGSTITFSSNIAQTYGVGGNSDLTGQIVVAQRVPNYSNVTINNGATLTSGAWNGGRNGIVAFKVSGTLLNNGAVSANGLGYRGGTAGTTTTAGSNGESFDGYQGLGGYSTTLATKAGGNGAAYPSTASPNNGFARTGGGGGGHAANCGTTCGGGGGGGGGYAGGGAGGGGGGSNATGGAGGATGGTTGVSGGGGGGNGVVTNGGAAGGNAGSAGNNGAQGLGGQVGSGATSASGAGGSNHSTAGSAGGGGGGGINGVANLSKLYFGGGGGGGGANSGITAKAGNDGGGIVMIYAYTLTNSGTISATGNNGRATADSGGGGGAGAGGSILIKTQTATLGSNTITALGGAATSANRGGGSGAGGVGRIAVYYVNSPTGTTNPTYTGTQISSGYFTSATIQSTNLLTGVTDTVDSIDEFVYNLSSKPAGTGATIQFSPNGTNWYNSAGQLGSSDTLTTGSNNTVVIRNLGWSGANFYYKAAFTGDSASTPTLDDVSVNYTTSGSCLPSLGGDFTLTKNCSFANIRDGVDNGNLTIPVYKTLTVNAGQTIGWNEGKGITIATGGSIALNTGAGTTINDSAGVNNGTATGTTLIAGKYDKARSFVGTSNDYINLGDSTTLKPSNITVETWFKTDTTSGSMLIRKRGYGYGIEIGNFVSGASPGQITFWIYDAGAVIYKATSPLTYNDNAWHHAAGVYNGSKVYLYIDGVSVIWSPAGTINYNTGAVALGRDGDSSAAYYTGSLDDVRIYNYARTFSQIAEDMNNTTITGNPAVGLWTMDDQAKLQQSYLWVPDANGDFMIDTSISDQVYRSTQPTSHVRRKDATGYMKGDARDGSVTFTVNTNLNTWNHAGRTCADGGDAVNYSVTALGANSATLSTSPSGSCLVAGDSIILINLQGTYTNMDNVGNYEILTVSSVSTNTVNFTTNKQKYYGNGASDDTNIGTTTSNQRVMLQRVPQYGDVTVNNGITVTANGWSNPKGGVLAFKASGTVTASGGTNFSMNSLGFKGGTVVGAGCANSRERCGGEGGEAWCGPGGPAGRGGVQGTVGAGGGGTGEGGAGIAGAAGYCGAGSGSGGTTATGGYGSAAKGGAGGGGGGGGAASGGGAGYGTAGACAGWSSGSCVATCTSGGTNTSGKGGDSSGVAYGGCMGGGGGTYGVTNLSKLYLGSGGGMGGTELTTVVAGTGGYGGGIILIMGGNVSLTGSIASAGGNGGVGSWGSGYGGSGGGGGSGGSIKIMGATVALGSNLVTSAAGVGGDTNSGDGGAGGVGRIAVWGTTTVTGTTNPTYNTAQ